MKIVCLGSGEAYDAYYPNSSYLVMSEGNRGLLECGYSMVQQLWRVSEDPNFLDWILLTHAHDDHLLGLRPVLARMLQDGREKPLLLLCPREAEGLVLDMVGWLHSRFEELEIFGMGAGDTFLRHGLQISCARTVHSMPNLAVRIAKDDKVICYSGDGEITPASEALYQGADLVVHEGYVFGQKRPGHASIEDAIAMAERQHVKTLWLTHLQRRFRKLGLPMVRDKITSKKVRVSIPEPGHEIEL